MFISVIQMKWIKCSDRLPPENTWVLGANSERVESGVWLENYHGSSGFHLPDCNYLNMEITHWMPLPSPPKNSRWTRYLRYSYWKGRWREKFPKKGSIAFLLKYKPKNVEMTLFVKPGIYTEPLHVTLDANVELESISTSSEPQPL